MAPAVLAHYPSAEHVHHFSRSLFSLLARSSDTTQTAPLASLFAVILGKNAGLKSRSTAPIIARTVLPSVHMGTVLQPLADGISKRQTVILAIPTTYQGLNDGPAPGVVVGIMLGAIGGFVVLLYILLMTLKLATGGAVVEEEIITTRRKSRSRSRSRAMSETPRRETRRETVVIEERVQRSRPASVVEVEEEHEDIVEVIEEHSPERRPSRRESKRTSGFRTVDPAEFGGGDRPMRKVSRR